MTNCGPTCAGGARTARANSAGGPTFRRHCPDEQDMEYADGGAARCLSRPWRVVALWENP